MQRLPLYVIIEPQLWCGSHNSNVKRFERGKTRSPHIAERQKCINAGRVNKRQELLIQLDHLGGQKSTDCHPSAGSRSKANKANNQDARPPTLSYTGLLAQQNSASTLACATADAVLRR